MWVARWRALPEPFGPCQTVRRRCCRWIANGVPDELVVVLARRRPIWTGSLWTPPRSVLGRRRRVRRLRGGCGPGPWSLSGWGRRRDPRVHRRPWPARPPHAGARQPGRRELRRRAHRKFAARPRPLPTAPQSQAAACLRPGALRGAQCHRAHVRKPQTVRCLGRGPSVPMRGHPIRQARGNYAGFITIAAIMLRLQRCHQVLGGARKAPTSVSGTVNIKASSNRRAAAMKLDGMVCTRML